MPEPKRFARSARFAGISPASLFAWHARPGAFERLAPPWESIELIESAGGIEDGARVVFRVKKGGVPIRWVAEHEGLEPGSRFVDVQRFGPFASWRHVHMVRAAPGGSELFDEITYELPGGAAGAWAAGGAVRAELERMFCFRHERTMRDLERHERWAERPRMRVAITGASGLIGRNLAHFLTTGGHTVHRLVRNEPERETDIGWEIDRGRIDASALEGIDALVHLAGEPVNQRWSAAARRRILESRERSTSLLASTIAGLKAPPKVWLSGSAVGYYGARGDELLDESSASGSTFLAEVCRRWEGATAAAEARGIRVVHLRTGVVLSPQGGALAQMLGPFKLGLGGRVGSGRQYMSWISLDDEIGAIHHALMDERASGALNLVAPNPVTNADLTDALGRALHRPTLVPVPTFALRMALGSRAAEELLLTGQRAVPTRLEELGFSFCDPELDGALRFMLGRSEGGEERAVASEGAEPG